jgi:hypothetical protein
MGIRCDNEGGIGILRQFQDFFVIRSLVIMFMRLHFKVKIRENRLIFFNEPNALGIIFRPGELPGKASAEDDEIVAIVFPESVQIQTRFIIKTVHIAFGY